MKWHELKWPIVQSLDKELPVVVPLGSLEQHGHHLPLFTDTLQVSAIMHRIDAKLEERVLVLPTLWLGSSHHHLDFPGTVSVRPSLYTQLLIDLTSSLLRSGFRRLFFLNGHGGNETPAAQALTELAVSDPLAQQSLLALANWWSVGKPDQDRHHLQTSSINHACEYETSLMLYIRHDLVDKSRITDSPTTIESTWLTGEKRVALFRRFAAMTSRGSLGMPSAATAQKGESILNSVVDDTVAFLEEFARWPLPKTLGPQAPEK